MFDTLTDKFNDTFRKLSGRGKISESNVHEAMDEVRSALLEADVHYKVAQQFVQGVMTKAIGEEVLQSLKPGQQLIKIVHDELVQLMAGPKGEATGSQIMYVDPGPTVLMMCGLQGAGKTTTCGKLAAYLKKQGKTVMLVAADLQRPAAIDQLETLSTQVRETSDSTTKVQFYCERHRIAEYGQAVGAAVAVCRNAVKEARKNSCDVVILDTAGRLHVNDELMNELRQVNSAVNPHQIFLVLDAMTGQDAVNSAKAFNDQLELDGIILTKFDSDTRGGAALSVKQITSKPIRFVGVGEKLEALEEFHPERIAGRILGMGDVVSLVEKAQQQVSEEEAMALQEKMAKGKMTMDDFLNQLRNMRRMGSMKSLIGMMPGIGNQLKDVDLDDKQINRTEAIIKSMTAPERQDVDLLNNSRRRRISRGSGSSQQDVSQLVKSFEMVSQLAKQMSGMGMVQRLKTMSGLGKMDLASLGSGRGAPKLKGATRPSRQKFKQRRRRSR